MNLDWFQLNLHNAPYTSQSRLSLTAFTSSMEPTLNIRAYVEECCNVLVSANVEKNPQYGGHELSRVAKPFVYFRSLSLALNTYLLAFIQFIGCNGL